MPEEDTITVTGAALMLHPVNITPEMVETEAKRFAMRSGGILVMAMSERGISEDQLCKMLEISKGSLRQQLLGQGWRSYLPLAALCLALSVRMDLKASHDER